MFVAFLFLIGDVVVGLLIKLIQHCKERVLVVGRCLPTVAVGLIVAAARVAALALARIVGPARSSGPRVSTILLT